MKDYSYMSMGEVVNQEATRKFIDTISLMDKRIVANRLRRLLDANGLDVSFHEVIGQFMSMIDVKVFSDSEEG